ncbi:hypothetical protein INR49_013255 [Caranx melampygus]|nr:hypothetical protein INR49_013255 [Caranx melampygus]
MATTESTAPTTTVTYDYYYADENCYDPRAAQYGATFTPVFFSIVVVFSLIGNTLVIVILAKYENLKSLTNAFILNLALSDLFSTAGLPFWAYYHMYGWNLGEVACKIVSFVFSIGFYSSGILLILMTIHRYIAVMKPLSDIMSTTSCYGALASSVYYWQQEAVSSEVLKAQCQMYQELEYAFYISRIFAFSHCCLNPVFYVFVGIKFKNHLKKMLKSLGKNRNSIRSRQSRMTIISVTSGEELSIKSTMEDNSTPSYTQGDQSDDPVFLCDEIFDLSTITGVFFILVFVFSVAGNGLLVCVLVAYESLKNVTNLFVLNLAFSDLIFTLTLPFWATHFLHHWIFGDFWCKFMIAAYFVGLYSSIILLTAMTVDRFIMVVLHNWPNNCVKRQRCALAACIAAWVISIAASLSDAVNVQAETNWYNRTTCEDLSTVTEADVGHYLQVSLLFFLPLVIIVFCYSAILKTVLQSTNRKRNRTVVVVLCIVATFFICWGPYNVLLFLKPLYKPITCDAIERLSIAFKICQIFAFSHCCMNPLLYMLSQKLRKHLLHLLSCEKKRPRNSQPTTNSLGTCVLPNTTMVVQSSAVMLELDSK